MLYISMPLHRLTDLCLPLWGLLNPKLLLAPVPFPTQEKCPILATLLCTRAIMFPFRIDKAFGRVLISIRFTIPAPLQQDTLNFMISWDQHRLLTALLVL